MWPIFSLTDAPDVQMLAAISSPLLRFNEACSGRAHGYRALAIGISHPDTAELVGGLSGWTFYSFLQIDLIYVPDSLRGNGIGRQLVRQAEDEAIRRGCYGCWLDTFSFQSRGFYERLGYQLFGTLSECPPGYERFFMAKVLVDG